MKSTVSPPWRSSGCVPLKGSLKVPEGLWDSLSASEIENLTITISILHSRLSAMFERNGHYSFTLSKNRDLHVDVKNGALNFYLNDRILKKRTQKLTLDDIRRIEWRESDILEDTLDYRDSPLREGERRANALEQTLLHHTYAEVLAGRSPPPYFGIEYDEDFELKIAEPEP